MKYFIANWKANKNLNELNIWIDEFLKLLQSNPLVFKGLASGKTKIIICPPFPLIYPLREKTKRFNFISLGSQDISSVSGGTFTGEVTAFNLSSLIDYSIIGHSERKKNNFENLSTDKAKIANAVKYSIEPIYCIADSSITIPNSVNFVCYEPPDAISAGDGRGKYLQLEEIINNKKLLHLNKNIKFIYGGSANKDNVGQYINCPEIDGILSGGASLDPEHFFMMINSFNAE